MKKPRIEHYKAYANELYYKISKSDLNPGNWTAQGYYLSAGGPAVYISAYFEEYQSFRATTLYIKWYGREYKKTYPDQIFKERGLRLICARFAREVEAMA